MIKILLVDAECLFRKAFSKMLSDREDCELVGIAATGSQAMEKFCHERPQIVFLETRIGNDSGVSLCKKMKEQAPDTAIYFLSNFCSVKLMQKAMVAGMEEYLYKPLSREKLRQILSENQYLEEEKEDSYTNQLLSSIEEKEYKKSYDFAKEFVGNLFKGTSEEERKEKLKDLASRLFYMIPGMDRRQKEYYFQKYELGTKIFQISIHCYCWLVQVITEVYKQLCVMKHTQMNQVFQYIEKNKNNEMSLLELSGQAGISSGYLSRIFKKYYHISVVDYIHLRKLHLAKYYMLSSEMNISDISFLLGYSEAGYFCKIFKKYEGMTPSAFHNQYIKRQYAG